MSQRRAKIVATLGPATDGLERELVQAGLDAARLNFSHGTPEEHARRCRAIRQAASELGRVVAVIQDLQGPKIRVGRLVGGEPVRLVAGRELAIVPGDEPGTAERLTTTYPRLAEDVKPGDRLLLDDGKLRLRVTGVAGGEIRALVEVGGPLGEHKGINLPGVNVSEPALTEVDREHLRFGLAELEVDYVALSFVRSAAEVRAARQLIAQLGHDTPLIAKLEKGEAIADLPAIVETADALMVARGDLGVELGPEEVPALQKRIIGAANDHGSPVITATQMLESMTTADTPTRAEASDVANAVWDGSDAVMLSGETAVGAHPPLVVETMDRIVRSAEAAALPRSVTLARHGHAGAVAHAAKVLADDLPATAIAAFTRSGRTAHLLAAERPAAPIFAFSPDERICRRLALVWGVTPVHQPRAGSLEAAISAMEGHLRACGAASSGDVLVIAGAQPFEPGVQTNFVRYHRLA